MDTSFEYIDKTTAYISSTENSWYKKMLKLQEQYPEQVKILRTPEENAGYLYASFPVDWIKIRPKKILTDAEKAERREAFLRNISGKKKNENDSIPEDKTE